MTAPCVAVVAGGTDLWFGSESEQARAKVICAGCPTRVSCLAGAIERGESCGVWGGRSFEPAAVFVLLEPTAHIGPTVQGCGTHAAYVRGCRCSACRKGHAAFVAERRAAAVTDHGIVAVVDQLNLFGVPA